MKRAKEIRSAAISIRTDSPPKKKKRPSIIRDDSAYALSQSQSPDHDSVITYNELDHLRNQLAALQGLSKDSPVYSITYQAAIEHLKKRPGVRTTYDDEDKRFTWDVSIDEDIHYRYEFINIGQESVMRCMFWVLNRFVELMMVRLSPTAQPIIQVHNMGYIPLSLQGSQFTHHYYAFEFFIRFLYNVAPILKRRKMLYDSIREVLQRLPENPMILPIQVTVTVPSPTFATEMQIVDIGTLEDLLFAKPRLPPLPPTRGGKRKAKK